MQTYETVNKWLHLHSSMHPQSSLYICICTVCSRMRQKCTWLLIKKMVPYSCPDMRFMRLHQQSSLFSMLIKWFIVHKLLHPDRRWCDWPSPSAFLSARAWSISSLGGSSRRCCCADRGTRGISGSCSLQRGPSCSIKTLVILVKYLKQTELVVNGIFTHTQTHTHTFSI